MSNSSQNQPVLLLYFHPFGHKTATLSSYVQILTTLWLFTLWLFTLWLFTLWLFTFIMHHSCTLGHFPIQIPKADTRYQNTPYGCCDAGFTAQSG